MSEKGDMATPRILVSDFIYLLVIYFSLFCRMGEGMAKQYVQ